MARGWGRSGPKRIFSADGDGALGNGWRLGLSPGGTAKENTTQNCSDKFCCCIVNDPERARSLLPIQARQRRAAAYSSSVPTAAGILTQDSSRLNSAAGSQAVWQRVSVCPCHPPGASLASSPVRARGDELAPRRWSVRVSGSARSSEKDARAPTASSRSTWSRRTSGSASGSAPSSSRGIASEAKKASSSSSGRAPGWSRSAASIEVCQVSATGSG